MAQYQTDIAANAPNAGMLQQMYSTTFGNMAFQIMPATTGEIQAGFPVIPEISLEALFYAQQTSNQVTQPFNIQTGNTSGSQNISGQQTVTDPNSGQQRVSIGYSSSASF